MRTNTPSTSSSEALLPVTSITVGNSAAWSAIAVLRATPNSSAIWAEVAPAALRSAIAALRFLRSGAFIECGCRYRALSVHGECAGAVKPYGQWLPLSDGIEPNPA
jgi:hypothetical protein